MRKRCAFIERRGAIAAFLPFLTLLNADRFSIQCSVKTQDSKVYCSTGQFSSM
ncbi:hypothetical protein Mapa_015300 [Marchantia paleacea]|nr:hypothetical protein Mapa_015300 [Marchantia paleacea]